MTPSKGGERLDFAAIAKLIIEALQSTTELVESLTELAKVYAPVIIPIVTWVLVDKKRKVTPIRKGHSSNHHKGEH